MALPENPITREEQYYNAIATGGGEIPDPITRKEQYLAYIAGQDTDIPEYPITREEQYLAYIAENGGGGGTDFFETLTEGLSDWRGLFNTAPEGMLKQLPERLVLPVGSAYTSLFDNANAYGDHAIDLVEECGLREIVLTTGFNNQGYLFRNAKISRIPKITVGRNDNGNWTDGFKSTYIQRIDEIARITNGGTLLPGTAFNNATSLTYLRFSGDWNITNNSPDFSGAPLDHDSAANVINYLADKTGSTAGTVKFSATTWAYMTADTETDWAQVIADKNWTLTVNTSY